jgi:hypothetical protein
MHSVLRVFKSGGGKILTRTLERSKKPWAKAAQQAAHTPPIKGQNPPKIALKKSRFRAFLGKP